MKVSLLSGLLVAAALVACVPAEAVAPEEPTLEPPATVTPAPEEPLATPEPTAIPGDPTPTPGSGLVVVDILHLEGESPQFRAEAWTAQGEPLAGAEVIAWRLPPGVEGPPACVLQVAGPGASTGVVSLEPGRYLAQARDQETGLLSPLALFDLGQSETVVIVFAQLAR